MDHTHNDESRSETRVKEETMRMEKAVVLKRRNGRRVKMLEGHAIFETYFLHEHQPYKHVIQ